MTGARLLAILGVMAASSAQTPAPQQPAVPDEKGPVIRITVTLVQIDAVVTDRNGRHVADLKAEDFEIRQDGRPRQITHFSYIPTEAPPAPRPAEPADRADPAAPPAPAVPLRPEQVRRTIAMVVDDCAMSFESTVQVRDALKKFVDQQIQPGDLVAILRTCAGAGAFQQFTSDKRLLAAAIDRVRWNMLGRGGVSAVAPIEDDVIAEAAAAAGEEDPRLGAEEFREEYFSVGTLGTLRFLVSALRELPGRKSVVLFSDGIRILNREGVNSRITDALQQLTDLANRSSVVLYSIDARGLQTLSLTASDRVGSMTTARLGVAVRQRRDQFYDSQDGLANLARETGGLFLKDTNDLAGAVRQVIDDQKGYYLIGYNPDDSTFGRKPGRELFHRISVHVMRPGLRVRTRNGFFGVPDDLARPTTRDRNQRLFTALTSPLASTGVHLRLTSLFANNQQDGSFLRSMLHIDGRDLTFSPDEGDRQKAVIDVLAITFGGNGAEVDRSSRTYTLRAGPSAIKRILASGLAYTINLPVKKPGAYQLRIAVRDAASERVGSANQFVEVPDLTKGRLTLSGMSVTAEPPGMRKAAAAAPPPAQAEGAAEDVETHGTAALRIFRPGTSLIYALQIFNAKLDPAGHPQIETYMRVFRDGKRIYSTKPEPVPAGQKDLKRLLTAGRLELSPAAVSGDYVLQVVVTDTLADPKRRTASQWIDFELAK